ncbi:MAG: ABC transporter [unclassified Hahellaceae]|mgnify:CR=1 FL=1|nr:ABC transporter [Hahellaceae bacterium]|tara:strand:- start:75426 stop:76460 length:1035 start_codon:yes stop_codon:yes gene_type:complete
MIDEKHPSGPQAAVSLAQGSGPVASDTAWQSATDASATEPSALSIRGLTKVYDNGFRALEHINLEVRQGDFFGLLGPNGAGKSTTLGIVSSLVNKSEGEVRIFGHDISTDLEQAKRYLGVVPQEFNFNMFEKVEDVLITQAGYYGIRANEARDAVEYYLKALGLWDKRREQSRMLSGGMKRRLMIARALVHDPRLLILDEPTAGVDIELRRSMWAFLTKVNNDGKTIILTTHYLEEAEALCRNIAIIDKGEILQNASTHELLGQLTQTTFVLDVATAVTSLPVLPNYPMRLTTEGNIEVDVNRDQNLNELFTQLTKAGIHVRSMRTKTNRLEELFVRLVNEGKN